MPKDVLGFIEAYKAIVHNANVNMVVKNVATKLVDTMCIRSSFVTSDRHLNLNPEP